MTDWSPRDVFGALQRNGMLGEYDGGTWSRLLQKLFVADAPSFPEMMARMDALKLDERMVLDALMAALSPGTPFTQGRRAAMDGVFIARELLPEHADGARAAIAELAANYGIKDVAVTPRDMRAIHDALGKAFAWAGKTEQVYLVGSLGQMIAIRSRIEPIGLFAQYTAWRA